LTTVKNCHNDRKLGALTGVRFLAAAAVLVCHYHQLGLIQVWPGLVAFLDGGRPAVTLFFVLSGFILAYNYYALDSRAETRGFWVSRLARLYPNVLLGLAIAIPTVVIAIFDGRRNYMLDWFALDNHYALGLTVSFLAQLTMTTAWLPVASFNQPWNGPAWSIGCEVFFYLLFPLLIRCVRRHSTRTLLVILIVGFIAQGILIATIGTFAPVGRAGFLVSQFPVTHLYSFLLGISACRIYLSHGSKLSRVPWFRPVALSFSIACVSTLAVTQVVKPFYYPMAPFFALIILALALPTRRYRSVLSLAPLILLGEASYALYMTHLPLGHIFQWAGASGPTGWIALFATVVLSIAVLKWWETPMRKRIRTTLFRAYVERP